MSTTFSNPQTTQDRYSIRQMLNIKGLTLSLPQMMSQGRVKSGDSEFLALVMRRNIPYPPHIIDCSGTQFFKSSMLVCKSRKRQYQKPKSHRKPGRAPKPTTKIARREALQAKREKRLAVAP